MLYINCKHQLDKKKNLFFLKQWTLITIIHTDNSPSTYVIFELPLIPPPCRIFSFLNFDFPAEEKNTKTDVNYLNTIHNSVIHHSTVLIKVVQNPTFFSISNMLAARSVALLLCCNKNKQYINAHYLQRLLPMELVNLPLLVDPHGTSEVVKYECVSTERK